MKRLLPGTIFLLIGIAAPATFHGAWFLITLWVIVGLAGLTLIVLSDPVRELWLTSLKHQLDELDRPAGPVEIRVEAAAIVEELEHGLDILNSERNERNVFFNEHELATSQWKTYGSALAKEGLTNIHASVRKAYREIDGVNRSIERGMRNAVGQPVVRLNSDRVAAARSAIPEAVELLEVLTRK